MLLIRVASSSGSDKLKKKVLMELRTLMIPFSIFKLYDVMKIQVNEIKNKEFE